MSKLHSLLKVRACTEGAELPRGKLCKHHSVEFPIHGRSCGEFVYVAVASLILGSGQQTALAKIVHNLVASGGMGESVFEFHLST